MKQTQTTGMIKASREAHGGPQCGLGRWLSGLALVALLLACAPLAAQQDSTTDEQDGSKQVDESEENYRRRMELRDERFRDTPKINTTYAAPRPKDKLDLLPEASQAHIKSQLREMIFEGHEWQPGEDLTDYPYQPSAAAENQPALRKMEREAWVEQLQKYQQREADAYTAANGEQQGQESSQGSQSAAAGQNPGAAGQSTDQASTAAESAQQNAQASQGAASASEQNDSSARADEAVSTAGVSESALGFLQQGPGGAAAMPGAGQGAGSQAAGQQQAQQAGQQAGQQTAQQAGQQAAQPDGQQDAGPDGSQPDGSAAQLAGNAAGQAGSDDGQQNEAESAVEAPPGTLSIDELAQLQGLPSAGSSAAAAAAAPSTAAMSASANQPASGAAGETWSGSASEAAAELAGSTENALASVSGSQPSGAPAGSTQAGSDSASEATAADAGSQGEAGTAAQQASDSVTITSIDVQHQDLPGTLSVSELAQLNSAAARSALSGETDQAGAATPAPGTAQPVPDDTP